MYQSSQIPDDQIEAARAAAKKHGLSQENMDELNKHLREYAAEKAKPPEQRKKTETKIVHIGGDPNEYPGAVEMTVKRARTMMKEVKAALYSETSREAFQELMEDFGDDNDKSMRVRKGQAMADKFTKSVLEKYDITHGIRQAMESAVEAENGLGQSDRTIQQVQEALNELVSGEPSPTRIGRNDDLDKLANKFIDMSMKDRTAAMKTVNTTEHGEVYSAVMENINLLGDQYIIDETLTLAKKLGPSEKKRKNAEDMTEKERNKILMMRVKMNVMAQFFRVADHKLMHAKLEDSKKGSKMHTEL